jgi:hypothetical protein
MTNPGAFPGNRDFDSSRISLLNARRETVEVLVLLSVSNTLLFDRAVLAREEMRPMEQGVAFMIRLCSDRAAYEAVPKKRFKVDIASLRLALKRSGDYEIAVCTPQLIVARRRDATEVTIVDDGRMIIRNVADQEAARRIAETILPNRAVKKY